MAAAARVFAVWLLLQVEGINSGDVHGFAVDVAGVERCAAVVALPARVISCMRLPRQSSGKAMQQSITSWSRSSSGTTISPLDAPNALLMQRMLDACQSTDYNQITTDKIVNRGCDPHLVGGSIAADQLAEHALRLKRVHRARGTDHLGEHKGGHTEPCARVDDRVTGPQHLHTITHAIPTKKAAGCLLTQVCEREHVNN
jgi:hypothetical protein